LLHAYEILNDDVGNEDGLCQSNEACVIARNIGAYQGEGALGFVSTYSDANFSGISLYAPAQNGGP
jgi:hypothetical protein